MKKCGIAFETLVDYQEGRADAVTTEQVQTHLASGCNDCQSSLVRLNRMLAALPEADRLHVPEAALDRARNIFRERARHLKPERVPVRARLVFDSRFDLALSGARGEESQSTQLLYETDTHDVDLWQEKADSEHWYLIGQIFPKSGGDPLVAESVTLIPADGPSLTTSAVDAEFHLPSVLSGLYELRLQIGEEEIIVPDVLLGRREQ